MKKAKILSAVLSLMVGITALATVPVFKSVYATNEIKTETSDKNVKLSIKNSEQELSQKDIITLEIGVPFVLEYTASDKPEISTETNDIETVVNEDAKTITITANNTTYSRVNVIVPSTNESLYFTVTALHADYRTVTEYDDSPMHVGEMREIHFYHPKTKTATTADILEVSDNISVQ